MPHAQTADGLPHGVGMAQDSCQAEVLADAVAELERLNTASLRRRWKALVGSAIPPELGRPLTLRVLAYKLQAQHLGDLDKASVRELSRLCDRPKDRRDAGHSATASPTVDMGGALAAPGADPPKDPTRRIPRPGTLLTREYGGVLHRVTVLDEGVSYDGRTYDSLSKVAAEITGTNWNGPRFFGLRDRMVANANDDPYRQSRAAKTILPDRIRVSPSRRSSTRHVSS